jgi:hypothetical protein
LTDPTVKKQTNKKTNFEKGEWARLYPVAA